MRRARILYRDRLAGWLTEDEDGYVFEYDADYLSRGGAEPVSLTLPLRNALIVRFADRGLNDRKTDALLLTEAGNLFHLSGISLVAEPVLTSMFFQDHIHHSRVAFVKGAE